MSRNSIVWWPDGSGWHCLSRQRRDHGIAHLPPRKLFLVSRQQELRFLWLTHKLNCWKLREFSKTHSHMQSIWTQSLQELIFKTLLDVTNLQLKTDFASDRMWKFHLVGQYYSWILPLWGRKLSLPLSAVFGNGPIWYQVVFFCVRTNFHSKNADLISSLREKKYQNTSSCLGEWSMDRWIKSGTFCIAWLGCFWWKPNAPFYIKSLTLSSPDVIGS